MDDRADLGRRGEKQAERLLRRKRYRIVCRNYRCPAGEIDLIALDGKIVVFVEVKTRSSDELADPADAVNLEKQRRLSRSARCFIQQTDSQDRACRFDVVTIVVQPDAKLDIEHYEDAFAPRRG
jgi:putative endonuclease